MSYEGMHVNDFVSMDVGEDKAEQIRATTHLIEKVLVVKPPYIGIYAPGDFFTPTYRLVIPDFDSPNPGRGYHGSREMIALESPARSDVDVWITALKNLTTLPEGPLAVRHILNPACNKDEGLRFIWRKTCDQGEGGEVSDEVERSIGSGQEEMDDWPRRDRLIREGKTVQAEPGKTGWLESLNVGRGQMDTFLYPGLTTWAPGLLPRGVFDPSGPLSPFSPVSPGVDVSPYPFPFLSPLDPVSPISSVSHPPPSPGAMHLDHNETWDPQPSHLAPAE